MKKFLIDANLPYYFDLWNSEEYVHVFDINDEMTDEEIWKFAKENNLVIVTKDSDFSNMIYYNQPPPKVIHIRLGNMKIKEFHNIINKLWKDILKMLDKNKLVNVFQDRIEAIK